MSDWISVNSQELRITRRQQGRHHGVEIIFGLSPDDIPAKVRAMEDPLTREFVIELNYHNVFDEPTLRIPVTGRGAPVPIIGKYSGRLYELRFSDSPLALTDSDMRVAIDALQQDATLHNRLRHYEVAGEAVVDNSSALVRAGN